MAGKMPKGPHALTKAAEKRETKAQEKAESPAFQRMERKMGLEKGAGDRLSYAERKKMPKSEFAIPGNVKGLKTKGGHGAGKGAYPINDPAHARNALARVAQHGTPAEQAKVKAKVHAKYPAVGKKTKGK